MKQPPSITLVPAVPGQAADLSALTYRAKASHGYDESFMQLARTDLQISEEQVARDPIMLAMAGNRILGYAHLVPTGQTDVVCLENLFVEPDAQGVWHRAPAHELGRERGHCP